MMAFRLELPLHYHHQAIMITLTLYDPKTQRERQDRVKALILPTYQRNHHQREKTALNPILLQYKGKRVWIHSNYTVPL